MNKRFLACLCCQLGIVLAALTPAHALPIVEKPGIQVQRPTAISAAPLPALPTLIRIDVSSTPGLVIFNSTGAGPAIADSTSTTEDGMSLIGFFTGIPTGTGAGASILSPSGTSDQYNRLTPLPTLADLNFWTDGGTDTQVFDPSVPAFTGVATLGLSSGFAPVGSSGHIIVGDGTFGGSGEVIGMWVAVPEPSAFLYGGLISALAGCGAWIKRRQALLSRS